ncbi:unnamed protein product [Rotaria sp. Silwood2]|nr:unnamed protein product [Rotaria sp. Silwood2]
MSITVTEFYYTHLSQSNISSRLISLCVSDTLAIDNGLWLAEHLSTFINLHRLSLIDIKRSSFQLILNSLSPINSLIMFSLRFSTEDRAAYTFKGVPEGVYYERIFHLFPSLRVCHLFFWPYIHSTLDSQLVLPPGRTFMFVQISLLNLQSLALCCSPSFLSHLFEHLPQLEQLSYSQTTPWLPEKHPLRYSDHNRVTPINKHLAPNLCQLKIKWFDSMMNPASVNELFERDVLFSLMKFNLLAWVAGPHVLHNLQSMLSRQCLHSFDVIWSVGTVVSLSETSKILFDTFQQLKGPAPIELDLSLEENMYSIRALTVNSNEGKCSSKCVLNGHQRTADSLTELGQANIFQRIKCVVKRNLHLIIEYQQSAHRLVPNDIINGTFYKQIHTNSKFNRLTLSIHADGMQVITSKPKKFYVVTGTILEIPPPHREYARNKLLLVVYFSENEPTPLLLYDHLSQQLQQLINEKYVIIDGEKFNIRLQLFKADLPCRSLSICIKQHNGYYCCSNCLQYGKTYDGPNVYYPYTDTYPNRSHSDYIRSATEAERNQNQISVFGIHGKSPLLSLFANVQINCPFDYMHLCCR